MATFDQALALGPHPVRRRRSAFGEIGLPAYRILAAGRESEVRPLVVFAQGDDGTVTDMSFVSAVVASRRGSRSRPFDGPGQGECCASRACRCGRSGSGWWPPCRRSRWPCRSLAKRLEPRRPSHAPRCLGRASHRRADRRSRHLQRREPPRPPLAAAASCAARWSSATSGGHGVDHLCDHLASIERFTMLHPAPARPGGGRRPRGGYGPLHRADARADDAAAARQARRPQRQNVSQILVIAWSSGPGRARPTPDRSRVRRRAHPARRCPTMIVSIEIVSNFNH